MPPGRKRKAHQASLELPGGMLSEVKRGPSEVMVGVNETIAQTQCGNGALSPKTRHSSADAPHFSTPPFLNKDRGGAIALGGALRDGPEGAPTPSGWSTEDPSCPIPSTGIYPRQGGTMPYRRPDGTYAKAGGSLECARCGGLPPPLQRCMMVIDYYQARAEENPMSRTTIASFVLCSTCAFTIANCLERGAGQTTIFCGVSHVQA